MPHADWSPDPSWPPPPPGWRLWVDEDDPDAPAAKSALDRLKQAGDDGEYFGDENAWAEDSGPAPADEELDACRAAASRPRSRPKTLRCNTSGGTPRSSGMTTQYDIGKIVAVSADAAAVNLKLAGIEAPVSFPRGAAPGGPGNPRLFVWI